MGAPKQGMHAEKPYEITGGDYSALLATTCVLTGTNHIRWESLANARLIAASPDLLQVVIDLLPYAQAAIRPDEAAWPVDSVILKARAAIAKATGEK
jgi:hypothetical protein